MFGVRTHMINLSYLKLVLEVQDIHLIPRIGVRYKTKHDSILVCEVKLSYLHLLFHKIYMDKSITSDMRIILSHAL